MYARDPTQGPGLTWFQEERKTGAEYCQKRKQVYNDNDYQLKIPRKEDAMLQAAVFTCFLLLFSPLLRGTLFFLPHQKLP